MLNNVLHRLTRKLRTIVFMSIIGVAISSAAQAQVYIADSVHGRRLLVPDSSGLAYDTPLNRSMFQGVQLSRLQRDSIDRLARHWKATNTARRTERSSHAEINTILTQLERERLSYRKLLTPAQQKRFDLNTRKLLAAWKRAPQISADAKKGDK